MEQRIMTRKRKGIVIRLREATQLLWATDVDLEGGEGGLLFPIECVTGANLALQIQILKTMLFLVGTLKTPRASYTEFEVRSLCRKGEKKNDSSTTNFRCRRSATGLLSRIGLDSRRLQCCLYVVHDEGATLQGAAFPEWLGNCNSH